MASFKHSTKVLPAPSSRLLGQAIEEAFARMKDGAAQALRSGAIAGALAFAPLLAGGCDGDAEPATEPTGDELGIGGGKADWVQNEGQRNSELVSYLGSSWHQYTNCGERGGCAGVDLFLKLQVRPVEGAVIDKKHVGVVYRSLYPINEEHTSVGEYFSTYQVDGVTYEEWHVPVHLRSYGSPGTILFTAWYQDGLGHTYYDDNNGEFHVSTYQGNYIVVRQDWDRTHFSWTDDGRVQGTVSVILANLDYDKQLKLVWTNDKWATPRELGMGQPDETNSWHWVENLWGGYERWELKLDQEAGEGELEYAISYRHGVVNEARVYEFWDNNGGANYVIEKPTE